MARALDHIVWPARNLGALVDTFRRLGFTVGRRNRHPWGTVNHIIQVDGAFLEVLGFAEDYLPVLPDDAAYPFATFCHRFLETHEGGAAMLVLRSDDAVSDARLLATRGLGHNRLLPFARTAQGPDGADRTVSFTVAFADVPGLPQLGAFLCQQHRPENFWSPAAQQHANGATAIATVTVGGVDDRSKGADGLRLFADAPSGQNHIRLANGSRIILDPASGAAPLTAIEVAVPDIAAVEACLDSEKMSYETSGERLILPADVLPGTSLVFTQRAAVPPG